jgi:thiamine biosynthesis lipoprotein
MAVTEHRFRVMASDAHLIAVDAPPGALTDARRALELIEQRWSRFLPDSDISRINLADGRPVVVDPLTLTLIATMAEAWSATQGRYDPTVLPILVADGYRSSIVQPSRVTILPATTQHAGGVAAVLIDAERWTVTAPTGVALDPGAIGKGLAADLVVAQLLAAGAGGALVDVGGDLACAGTPPLPDGWPVAVESMDDPGADLVTFTVSGGGVATSSTRSRRWIHDGAVRHHVIDPASGAMSDTDLDAVTVIARSGWLAEAHATGAILAGSVGVLGYLATHDLSGLAVTSTGGLLATPDLIPAAPDCALVSP